MTAGKRALMCAGDLLFTGGVDPAVLHMLLQAIAAAASHIKGSQHAEGMAVMSFRHVA